MNQNDMLLRLEDLVTNPTTRLPVCLCLDVSYSMNGKPLRELINGVHNFFKAIKDDEIARYSVELSIVTFHSKAELILDFASIDRQKLPTLSAQGMTSMGEGVNLALDILETRKNEYSNRGIDYYQPWMVLMSDGGPTDNITSAVNRVEDLVNNKKLTVFPVALGSGANVEVLRKFSSLPNKSVLRLTNPENFREFFQWLSQSVAVASQSTPGDKPTLPELPRVIEITL